MTELSQKILKNEKKYLHLVNLYDIVIFAVRDNRTADMNKAPWSSGQDASLSRWNQGFDSPRSHCTKSRKVLQKDLTGLFLPVFRQSRIIKMMIDSCV